MKRSMVYMNKSLIADFRLLSALEDKDPIFFIWHNLHGYAFRMRHKSRIVIGIFFRRYLRYPLIF